MEQKLLQELVDEIKSIKTDVVQMKLTLDEIDQDLHRKLNPEYEKHLNKLLEHGNFKHFSSVEELKKSIESG